MGNFELCIVMILFLVTCYLLHNLFLGWKKINIDVIICILKNETFSKEKPNPQATNELTKVGQENSVDSKDYRC